jgi:hypothetical protein
LEQQLGTLQSEHSQTAQQLTELQAQQVQLQTENQFWNIVATEFPQLMQLAPTLQRNADADQQREIFKTAASIVGATIQAQTQAQVQQAMAGVVPGASPPAGGAAPQYDRESVALKLDELTPGTTEYNRYMKIWDEITKDDARMLHPEWHDTVESDWEVIRRQQSQIANPTTAPGAHTAFRNVPGGTP